MRLQTNLRIGTAAALGAMVANVTILCGLDYLSTLLHFKAGLVDDVPVVSEAILFPLSVMIAAGVASAVGASLGLKRRWSVLIVTAATWVYLEIWGLQHGTFAYSWEGFDNSLAQTVGIVSPRLPEVFLTLVASAAGAAMVKNRNGLRSVMMALSAGVMGAFVLVVLCYPLIVGQTRSEQQWQDLLMDARWQLTAARNQLRKSGVSLTEAGSPLAVANQPNQQKNRN